MKITRLETFTDRNISIVRLTTDDGAQGWGQMSTFNADISAQVFHRQVAPHALGADPMGMDSILDYILEAEYKFPGSYVCRALCGLDTAVWDLRGRLEGKSVCELLGGTPRPFPVYGSSMSREITPEAEAARLAALKERFGYRAFKARVGKVCGHDEDQWPGRTEALIPAVRGAIGEETTLLVDGNSCYTPARAIQVGQMLEQYSVGHFEEPCPYWELEWTAEVAAALDVPVAGGEQDYDLNQWRRIVNMHAVDIVQPDIGYIGGLSRALRVAKMAQQAGRVCVPHSANLALVVVFSLHMMGAIPNAGPHVEFTIESGPWWEGLYRPALVVKDGMVEIPGGPGWGVEINPGWLAQAEHQCSETT
jgi:L-alanine-DL-glutamate epimerase-like enolase superfamily enzyme